MVLRSPADELYETSVVVEPARRAAACAAAGAAGAPCACSEDAIDCSSRHLEAPPLFSSDIATALSLANGADDSALPPLTAPLALSPAAFRAFATPAFDATAPAIELTPPATSPTRPLSELRCWASRRRDRLRLTALQVLQVGCENTIVVCGSLRLERVRHR